MKTTREPRPMLEAMDQQWFGREATAARAASAGAAAGGAAAPLDTVAPSGPPHGQAMVRQPAGPSHLQRALTAAHGAAMVAQLTHHAVLDMATAQAGPGHGPARPPAGPARRPDLSSFSASFASSAATGLLFHGASSAGALTVLAGAAVGASFGAAAALGVGAALAYLASRRGGGTVAHPAGPLDLPARSPPASPQAAIALEQGARRRLDAIIDHARALQEVLAEGPSD